MTPSGDCNCIQTDSSIFTDYNRVLFWRGPFHGITHNPADIGVEEDGIGLVAGLEIKYLALADFPGQTLPAGICAAVIQRVCSLEYHRCWRIYREWFAVSLVVNDCEFADAFGDRVTWRPSRRS